MISDVYDEVYVETLMLDGGINDVEEAFMLGYNNS